jgi:hypothetical protein
MALFTHEEIKGSSIPSAKAGAIQHPGSVSFWDVTQKKIESALTDMECSPDSSIHYVTEGSWSMHDLLYYFLARYGSSRVYITSWAISEIAMRQLYNFMKEGLITELYGLFDFRNTSRKPAELAFIHQNATKIKLAKCHAKVTVIENAMMPVTIVTSANYTDNPRYEAGVISFSPEVARFHKEWILKEILDDGTDQQ